MAHKESLRRWTTEQVEVFESARMKLNGINGEVGKLIVEDVNRFQDENPELFAGYVFDSAIAKWCAIRAARGVEQGKGVFKPVEYFWDFRDVGAVEFPLMPLSEEDMRLTGNLVLGIVEDYYLKFFVSRRKGILDYGLRPDFKHEFWNPNGIYLRKDR